MQLEKYIGTTYFMSTEEIDLLFKNVIEDYKKNVISRIDFINYVRILTGRQISTYELINENTKSILDDIFLDIWDEKNINELEEMFYIVVNLGLKKTYNKAKDMLNYWKDKNRDIYCDLNDMFITHGDDISNPMKSYEKYK